MAKSNSSKTTLPQTKIKAGFRDATVLLQVSKIIPVKILNPQTTKSTKYLQILASIRAVGIIEPPVVARDPQNKNQYILLDGHLRIEALKELKETEVTCLISTDDEAFTYNKHVNRLSVIQEHKMILHAIECGVPEKKIAEALNVDTNNIVRKRDLLKDICPHAVELLKDKMVSAEVFPILRRMKELRQIEAATLMNDAGIYSRSYAKALLAATPRDQLVEPERPKNIKGLDEDQMARMESEMESLQREYRLIEENYGTDVLNLTLVKAWLARLLSNTKVSRYLGQNHPEFLAQFQKIAEMKSLNAKEAA